jgi:hypothetical protein
MQLPQRKQQQELLRIFEQCSMFKASNVQARELKHLA